MFRQHVRWVNVKRLSRFAPEEIAAAVMLVVVLALVLARPTAIGQLFESPYATPAPGGGAGSDVIRSPAPVPTIGLFPRPTPATEEEAAQWIRWGNGPQATTLTVPPRSVQIDAQCRDRVVAISERPNGLVMIGCLPAAPTPLPAR